MDRGLEMPEYVCQYANCTNTEVIITVTSKRDTLKARFCSYRHLALWATKEATADYRQHSEDAIAKKAMQENT